MSDNGTISNDKRAELLAAARGQRRNVGPIAMGIRIVTSQPDTPVSEPVAVPEPTVEEPIAAPVRATEIAALSPAVPGLGELNTLLGKARDSRHARTQALGERIGAMLTELVARINAEDTEQQITDQILELEQQLANRREQLRELRRPAAGETSQRHDSAESPVDSKVVRAWATANGVPCPSHGRVPGRVVAAWRAATDGGEPQ